MSKKKKAKAILILKAYPDYEQTLDNYDTLFRLSHQSLDGIIKDLGLKKEAYFEMIDALIEVKNKLSVLGKEYGWFSDDLNEQIEQALIKARCRV